MERLMEHLCCLFALCLCLSSLPVYSKKSPVSNPGGRQTIEMMGGRHTITIAKVDNPLGLFDTTSLDFAEM